MDRQCWAAGCGMMPCRNQAMPVLRRRRSAQTHRCHFSSISGNGYAFDRPLVLASPAAPASAGWRTSASSDVPVAGAAAVLTGRSRTSRQGLIARRLAASAGFMDASALGSRHDESNLQALLSLAWPSAGRSRSSMLGGDTTLDTTPSLHIRGCDCQPNARIISRAVNARRLRRLYHNSEFTNKARSFVELQQSTITTFTSL